MEKKTELVLVEAMSIFRMRYVVEVPVGKQDYAADTVVIGKDTDGFDIVELSQKHLDEVVSSMRVISKEEYLKIFNEDNDYLKSWSDEKKFDLVNRGYYDCE